MATTPDIERLAKAAAREVEAKIVHMLTSGAEGEVAAIIGFNDLQVEYRPKQVVFRRKLERGHWAMLGKATSETR
jgi:hypothetical protein